VVRHRLPLLILTVLALFAGACADAGEDEPSTAQPSAAEEQHLVVGTPADTFSTEGERANLGMFPVNANIFENLVRLSPTFQVEPWLAERWEYRGDNTWRFHLRDDVTFHDGQPLTAEAVEFSFDRLARGSGSRLGIGPDSTTVVDELTVDVTTTEPNLRLVEQLVHPSLGPIIAPGSDVATKPTGSGPFRFVEYVPEERLVIQRNDDYWGEPPILDEIEFRFIPDGSVRWFSLTTGEVDLIYDLPRQLLSEAEATDGVTLATSPPGSTEVMFLNRSGQDPYTIMSDPAVRLALGHAVDRDTVVEQIWAGSAEVSDTMTPASLLGSAADLVDAPDHDPAMARSILEGAGWVTGPDGIRSKEGRRLRLTMVNGYPPIDLRQPMPELVQAQLREVGIEVDIVETPELGVYTERLENGQGDVFLERVAQNDANPAFFGSAFFYSEAAGPYSTWFAAGPEFDQLLEQSLAATDREKATEMAARAMDVAIGDEAVVLPLAATYWLFAMKEDVDGFVRHGSARHVRWDTVRRTG
jgi:peptide/nickel transport system substrate-binding protein